MQTYAEDLSELKSFLDDGPDYHTTFKLLYDDLQVHSVNHPSQFHCPSHTALDIHSNALQIGKKWQKDIIL